MFWHLTVVALELAVLLLLIDANTAFACNWCATPPLSQPVLPPMEICPPVNRDLAGLIFAAGMLFVGHALFLLHRSAVE